MRIALVQCNPVIGDFSYNCQKIKERAWAAHRQDCDFVIFPEMAITGYPPQDLLERQSFVSDQDRAIEALLSELPPVAVMFGCVERRQGKGGKGLYNSAVVARAGKIIYRARKQLLPAYDVFDETRYFEPGDTPELFEYGGLRFGVTVCEDVWCDEIGEYDYDPVERIFAAAKVRGQQPDAMINISASPFHIDKERIRREILLSFCQKYHKPFLYCNQVGGQDSLLFDGRSMVMNGDCEIIAQALGFGEDMIIVDSSGWRGECHDSLEVEPVAAVYQGLVMGVRDYVYKCGFHSGVIGLSGGVDSALTAAVAVAALGRENVLGVALPSVYSSQESLDDAQKLADNLGCSFTVLPIAELVDSYKKSLAGLFAGLAEDLTEQNIQARIRGNLLMALSNKFGHLLLTTGNKSEMAVGYCTLYGDMSGGLAVISDVPKMMVYELARYVNREVEIIPQRILTKAPSAELKPDQTDQDDLPPYAILDQILGFHLEQGEGLAEIVDRGYDRELVGDILRRVRINEYKRKQAPMGLKVTSKAFGFGRRFPNVQNYRS